MAQISLSPAMQDALHAALFDPEHQVHHTRSAPALTERGMATTNGLTWHLTPTGISAGALVDRARRNLADLRVAPAQVESCLDGFRSVEGRFAGDAAPMQELGLAYPGDYPPITPRGRMVARLAMAQDTQNLIFDARHVILVGEVKPGEREAYWHGVVNLASREECEGMLKRWRVMTAWAQAPEGRWEDRDIIFGWRPLMPGAVREFTAHGQVFQVAHHTGQGGGWAVSKVEGDATLVTVRGTPQEAELDARATLEALRVRV